MENDWNTTMYVLIQISNLEINKYSFRFIFYCNTMLQNYNTIISLKPLIVFYLTTKVKRTKRH